MGARARALGGETRFIGLRHGGRRGGHGGGPKGKRRRDRTADRHGCPRDHRTLSRSGGERDGDLSGAGEVGVNRQRGKKEKPAIAGSAGLGGLCLIVRYFGGVVFPFGLPFESHPIKLPL